MWTVSLAYKCVFIAAALAEINYCSDKLHLPINQPITRADITAAYLAPPSKVGYQARIDTEHYSFCFEQSGKICYTINLNDDRGNKSLREYQEQISKITSVINTNDAYRIATNWLTSIDVNVKKLEKEHPPTVQQQYCYNWSGTNKTPINLPLFDVKWGKWAKPTVQIRISGVDGSLLKLRQEDDSYSNRPTNLIVNLDKLLAISDQEFLKYSAEERQKLITRFVTIKHASTNGASGTVVR